MAGNVKRFSRMSAPVYKAPVGGALMNETPGDKIRGVHPRKPMRTIRYGALVAFVLALVFPAAPSWDFSSISPFIPSGASSWASPWSTGVAFAAETKKAKKTARKTSRKKKAKKKINKNAVLLVPPGYNKKQKYPVLVAMPYTGGTARNFLEYYLFTEYNPRKSMQKKWEKTLRDRYPDKTERRKRAFFILVPYGKGSTRDHGWRGFAAAINRYEKRIALGLKKAAKKYPIERRRVVLAGHSLGGDLTWALTLRKPQRYSGAFISGSRTSYWEEGKLELLSKKKFRYFFSMGEKEKRIRLQGFALNLEKLYQADLNYRVFKAPNVGHEPPSKVDLFNAINFTLFGGNHSNGKAVSTNP